MHKKLTAGHDLINRLAELELFAKQHEGTITDRAIINEGITKARLAQDAMRQASGAGVYREGEAHFINSLIDEDPTKFLSKYRTLPKYRAVRNATESQMKGIEGAYGVKRFDSGQQSGDGQREAAMKWLKDNPKDPRAAAVKQKLGL
jgi:hypothetical protein